jgi:ribosomal protein L37AE/L43A
MATNQEKKEELTCPLCQSPLIREAIEAGKCQCCGHRFDPKKLQKSEQSQA